jgi:hypothetical protein
MFEMLGKGLEDFDLDKLLDSEPVLVWQPFLKDSWDRNVTLSWTEKQEVNHLSVVFNTFNDV